MKRLFTLLLFATLISSSIFAESDGKYHWFYVKAQAAPTGKGTIYVSEDNIIPETGVTGESELKFYQFDIVNGSPQYTAIPAEGYQFIGMFPTANPSSLAECGSGCTEETGTLSITSKNESDSDDVECYGFEPDTVIYAIFSKVNVKVPSYLSKAGSVDMNKVINDTDDEITITATPLLEGVEFDYWQDTKGNVIKQNPYTFKVTDKETYTAYFKGDRILTIDFGEGKFVPFWNASDAYFEQGIYSYFVTNKAQEFSDENFNTIQYHDSENAWGYYINEYDDNYNITNQTFVKYEGTIPTFDTNYELAFTNGDYYHETPFILSGVGVKHIVLCQNNGTYPLGSVNHLKAVAEETKIENLPAKDANNEDKPFVYYTFDGSNFVKATSGTLAAGSVYLALTDGVQYPIYATVNVKDSELALGIEEVTEGVQPQRSGIFTLTGQKIAAPVKGLNIINGKKVLVK